MKVSEKVTDKAVFYRYRDRILEITEHYKGCEWEDRTVPIDECACRCYEKQIFKLGRDAERDLFYKS